MNDPLTYLAMLTIVVQGIFAVALIRFRQSMGQWTEELRKERRSADAVTRSNQAVVDWLARHTNTSSIPLATDTDQQDVA